MVELGRLRGQTDFDVAQTLPIGKLREDHNAKLLASGEVADVMIPVTTGIDAVEALPGQKVHQLREQSLSGVHQTLSVQRPKRA